MIKVDSLSDWVMWEPLPSKGFRYLERKEEREKRREWPGFHPVVACNKPLPCCCLQQAFTLLLLAFNQEAIS